MIGWCHGLDICYGESRNHGAKLYCLLSLILVSGVEGVPGRDRLATPTPTAIELFVLPQTRDILQTDCLTASMLSRSAVSDRASTELPQSPTALKHLQPSRRTCRGRNWLQCLGPKSLGPKRQAQWRSVGLACRWRKVRPQTHALRRPVRGFGTHRRPLLCDEGGRDGRLRPNNSITAEVRNAENAMLGRPSGWFEHREFELFLVLRGTLVPVRRGCS